MSAPPYMKLYVADYLGDTYTLSVIEHGAYFLLLMAMWRAGGKLPADDAKLARIACCTPEQWAEIRTTVLAFFRRRGGLLTHKRVSEEMAKYETVSERRREAQKASEAKKGRKNNDEEGANAAQTDRNCTHNQNQNQNQIGEADASPPGDAAPAEAAPKTKTSRRKPEGPIPEGFPDAEAMQDAKDRADAAGVDLSVAREAERFRNHAEQNDRRCRDWRAAWRNWIMPAIEKAPKRALPLFGSTAANGAAPRFPGPPELRAQIAGHPQHGEGFVRSYLDRCGWQDVPERALIAPHGVVAAKLETEIGSLLRRQGIRIVIAEQPTGRTA